MSVVIGKYAFRIQVAASYLLLFRSKSIFFKGIAPRSGLWHRKDGYRGRKIKKPPPTIETTNHEEYMKGAGIDNAWPGYKQKTIICENFSEGKRGRRSAGKRSIVKNGVINW